MPLRCPLREVPKSILSGSENAVGEQSSIEYFNVLSEARRGVALEAP
jgi:hypothetical protein